MNSRFAQGPRMRATTYDSAEPRTTTPTAAVSASAVLNTYAPPIGADV